MLDTGEKHEIETIMNTKELSYGFVVAGGILFLLGAVVTSPGYTGPLADLGGLMGTWVLFFAIGVGLYLYDRFDLSLGSKGASAELQRQDILESTNWTRENKYQIRKSIGVGLLIAGVLAWALSAVLGLSDLQLLWLGTAAVGVVLVTMSWRLSRGIKTNYTHEVSVHLPDQIALHTFHVRLRQLVEDNGYAIVSETSPSNGGRTAAFADRVWLSHGSFKARRRPISETQTLLPEVEDDPYLSKILTPITLGLVSLLGGVSLTQVHPSPLAANPNTTLYDGAHLLGWLFVAVGIALVGYGYVRRTREWGEIYCVEEGTVYSSNVNLYDEDTRSEFDSHVTPNVSTTDTACELVVTLGAACTSLYDEDQLQSDLKSLAEEVQALSLEQRHEFFPNNNLSPQDIERPSKPSRKSTSD